MNTTLFSIRLLHSPHSLLHSLNRVFFVVCALFTATASKAEAEFTFTLIADSAGAFRDFDTSSFSLNVSGTVAFFAFLDTGAIYRSLALLAPGNDGLNRHQHCHQQIRHGMLSLIGPSHTSWAAFNRSG